jgi:teneurin
VIQDVVSSVFNNSYFLDLHFNIHNQDVFYFVKDNVMKLRDDTEELRRLGGMFNVTTHDINEHGNENGKELRLHGTDAIIIIKYGVDPAVERRRILKHSHKRAVVCVTKLLITGFCYNNSLFRIMLGSWRRRL